jgi:hypothetical protein
MKLRQIINIVLIGILAFYVGEAFWAHWIVWSGHR